MEKIEYQARRRVKPLAYIAGPYTHPDPILNTRRAIEVADALIERGFAVFVPHLTMLWHLVSPRTLEQWYEIDLAMLAHCQVLYRLPGVSRGADAEVAEARRLGIPVEDWDGERG